MTRAHFNRFGITIRRVYSDNDACYRHWLYRQTMRQLHLKQSFTRPYTPRTNGKAERFIQTALREWGLRSLLSELSGKNRAARILAP